jgi:DTW domain-containing protein YfiP
MRANNRWLASDSIRCPGCRLHTDLCVCALLVPRPTRTRVVLVTHVRELSKPTNTGRLALACIEGARLVERGHRDGGLASIACEPDSQPLLLYPVPGAIPLDAWKTAQPAAADRVTLVVPDGTWRQTKRVRYRIPGLAHLPSVCLPTGLPSLFRLRHAGSSQQRSVDRRRGHRWHSRWRQSGWSANTAKQKLRAGQAPAAVKEASSVFPAQGFD